MADPPIAQSDEMDVVSIDSDRAEPGAADANRAVCPLSVKSVNGQVTNGHAIVTGHYDFATVKWGETSAAAMFVLDYGGDLDGIFVCDALAFPKARHLQRRSDFPVAEWRRTLVRRPLAACERCPRSENVREISGSRSQYLLQWPWERELLAKVFPDNLFV
jgi:hypothetical protein